MRIFYILSGKIPILAKDVQEWSEWMSTADRHVAKTDLPGEVYVSTVFLGIDHDFRNGYEPVLFETMIFGGELEGYQDRYKTWDEAEAGHKEAVDKASFINAN